jgi:hypothetical protein
MRMSIGTIPEVLSIMLNLKYGGSACARLPYRIPYLEGSNRDNVVVGGDQPVHITVPFHLGDGLVHQLDIFGSLLYDRLRLCKFATFRSCCA